MRRALRKRSLEEFEQRLREGDYIENESANNSFVQTVVEDVSSGATSIRKSMRRVRAHVGERGASSCHPESVRLARMKPGNDARDFWRATDIPVELEKIWVPILDEKSPAGYKLQQQYMLMPHQIIAFVFNECNLEIPQEYIHQYWDNAIAAGEPFASAESRHRVPLGFYGDSAQLITKSKFEKLLCLWMNIVIFRPRSIRYSRFLLWSCDVEFLYKNKTVNSVLRQIVWSFNCLYRGIYPTFRLGNRPLSPAQAALAGQWITRQHHQFQVVELRGDWEFHKMIWQFKASWKGGVNVGICHRCPAMMKTHDPGLLYWNMDEGASWSQREFDTVEYIANMLPERNICPLIRLEKFDVSCIRWCMMHVLNLGLLMSLNGGALTMLAEQMEYWGPGTFQQQLDNAYDDFIAYCRRNKLGHSQQPFKVNKVKQSTGEILLNAKAWNGRIICSWLADTMPLAARGVDLMYDEGRLALACQSLKCMARYFWLCETNPRELKKP